MMRQSEAGFLLMGPSLAPLYANREAIRILVYPEDPERLTSSNGFVAEKIQSTLMNSHSSPSPFVTEFRSGKRSYLCRAYSLAREFSLGSLSWNSSLRPAVALVLERKAPASFDGSWAAERFHFTPREQQTLEFLVQGLTNKEIANRMKLSPHTVKVFLKLIMAKMGVSTRSGIVSNALTLTDS